MTNAIVDLSAVFWKHWHASDGEEINKAKRQTVAMIQRLGNEHDKVYVAIDSPPYKRKDVLPEYKATRTERPEMAIETLRETIDALDGCILCRSQGWEADDVIAVLSAGMDDATVYAVDKDLLQCCDITDPWKGVVKTAEETLGVKRSQVVDYLTLVGDKSDNLPGVPGIGPKTAVKLLEKYGSILAIYTDLMANPGNFSAKGGEALKGAQMDIDKTREVIKLNTNIEIEQTEIEVKPVETGFDAPDAESEVAIVEHEERPQAAIVRRVDPGFQQALEPVGVEELWKISGVLEASRLYGHLTRAGIAACIMKGRALGIDAVTSLDSIHVIKGKPTMAASLMVAMVLNSPKCEYFYCSEMSETSCTWKGKRTGTPEEQTRTFTIQDAQRMNLTGKDNWRKQPDVMLQWRCATALARQMFPDVIAGMYSREEME
jgi:5'-3' exonuclease